MDDLEKVKRAIVSVAFAACQPDNGDVFGWIDAHAEELAEAVLEALSK